MIAIPRSLWWPGAKPPSGRLLHFQDSPGRSSRLERAREAHEWGELLPKSSSGSLARLPPVARLAGGRFREWSGPPVGFLEEFFEEADGLSQADHDTADIILSVWGEDRSPFDYGTVVRFERLAIRATTRSSEIWAIIARLIEKEFAIRGSMLILKAFPLEFEGNGAAKGLPKRTRAMVRYYQHRMRVQIVPGPYGVEGWMWRALRYCPLPPMKPPRAPGRARQRR